METYRTTFSKIHVDDASVNQTEMLSTRAWVLYKQPLEEEKNKCQGCYDLKRWILSVSLRTFLLP